MRASGLGDDATSAVRRDVSHRLGTVTRFPRHDRRTVLGEAVLHAEREAMSIAREQLGLMTRAQARAVGCSDTTIDRRVASGAWRREHPGVFAVAGSPRSWEQRVLAAVLAAGPGAVASHGTAASLHGMAGASLGRLEVTVPGTTLRRIRSVVVHRSLVLPTQDRVMIGPIATTSYARTLVDNAARWSVRRRGGRLDDALVRNTLSVDEAREIARRLGPAPGRRIRRYRSVANRRGRELGAADSIPESRLYRLLVDAGFPEPVQQLPIRAAGRAVSGGPRVSGPAPRAGISRLRPAPHPLRVRRRPPSTPRPRCGGLDGPVLHVGRRRRRHRGIRRRVRRLSPGSWGPCDKRRLAGSEMNTACRPAPTLWGRGDKPGSAEGGR